MSEIRQKLPFNPSNLETIDAAVLNFVKELKLHTETAQGWRPVPVVWAGNERSAQWKDDPERRDREKTIVKPVISVRRTGKTKSVQAKGAFYGNVPPSQDVKGHTISIARKINQTKTRNFAGADLFRTQGKINFPRKNEKVVYEVYDIPQPVYVGLTYEIKIETNYQQQMNDLTEPFISRPGSINYLLLRNEGWRYEAFINEDFTENNNLDSLEAEERMFETIVGMRVHGKIIGEGKNDPRPTIIKRENAVEVKIPRETVIVGDENTFDENGFFVPRFK